MMRTRQPRHEIQTRTRLGQRFIHIVPVEFTPVLAKHSKSFSLSAGTLDAWRGNVLVRTHAVVGLRLIHIFENWCSAPGSYPLGCVSTAALMCRALTGGNDQRIRHALNLRDVVAANSQPVEIGFQAFDQGRVHALARRAGTL
jgi:hypothetical protein